MGGPIEKKHKPRKNYMRHNDISDSCESSSDEHVNKQQINKTNLPPVKSDRENSALLSKMKNDLKIEVIKFNKRSQIKQEERVQIKIKDLPKFESSSEEQWSEEEKQGDMTLEASINHVPVATSSEVEGKRIKKEKLAQSQKQEINTEDETKNSSPTKTKLKKMKIIPNSQNIKESKRKLSLDNGDNEMSKIKNVPIKVENEIVDGLEQRSPKKIKHKYAKTISDEKLQPITVKGSKKTLRDSLVIEPTDLYPLSENISIVKQETKDRPKKKKKTKKKDASIPDESTEDVTTFRMKPLDVNDSNSQCDEMLEFSDQSNNHKKLKIEDEELDEVSQKDSVTRDDYFFQLLSQSSIAITWEIPTLHTLTPDVTRHPSEDVRHEIMKSGVPWTQGRFSPNEEKILRKNWRRLCVRYNLPDCPDVFGRWRNKKNNKTFRTARKKVLLFLARGLPDRTLVQVYHHFVHRLGAKTKGRFSEEEELMVEVFRTDQQYQGVSQQFLGSILGRDPPSIWRYITKLKLKEKSNANEKKVKWTLELCETYIKLLLRLVNEQQDKPPESLDLEVLRDPINIEIWRKLGKEMNLTPLQVKIQWLSKLYVQFFVTEPIYLTTLRYKLLQVLQTKNYPSWQNADWKDVATHFPNFTSLFLWGIFYKFAKQFGKSDLFNQFNDIGANITDEMYNGVYHGSKKHIPDLDLVMKRCWEGGMEKMIITGGSLADCETALRLAETDDRLYTTIGCHPTRCNAFKDNPEEYLSKLKDLAAKGGSKIVAIGECGLDYDRLKFCSKEVQKKYFNYQLELCETLNLPLFLHCRAAWDDFFEILSANESKLRGGVVHSFDGSEENLKECIRMGFYIGINGCSLKTSENLEVVAKIPIDKLLLETDCPWCEIKPSHAGSKYIKTLYPAVKKEKFSEGSMVKGRNEPVNITQVLEVVAGARNTDPEVMCKTILENTKTLFFSK